MPQVTSKDIKVVEFEGIEIFLLPRPAKKNGKDHVWIKVRQTGKKKPWNVYANLSYRNGVDINLIKE